MIWFAQARKVAFFSVKDRVWVPNTRVKTDVCCPCLSLLLWTLFRRWNQDVAQRVWKQSWQPFVLLQRGPGEAGWSPSLAFLKPTVPKHFSLSLFQGMFYGELQVLLSLHYVLIYSMRSVIIEFGAECWAFSISSGVFLGTRWIAQYAWGKK